MHDGTAFYLHVQVIAADSAEVAELRTFRSWLREDHILVASYVAAKDTILAEGVTDRSDYAIRKGEFVSRALEEMAQKRRPAGPSDA